jgi:Zn-dependent protease with chaperone function
MVRQAAEIALHGVVATCVVALIIQWQASRAPAARLRLWLLALLAPVLLSPIYRLLGSARTADGFRDDWALLSGTHWSPLAWHDVSAGAWCFLLATVFGALLFLRDLVPFVVEAVRNQPRPSAEAPPGLVAAAARAGEAMGMPAPRLRFDDARAPNLSCRGWRRPVLVASQGLVDLLDADELAAALAHEMSHARRRDTALGFVVMLVRAGFFFSPGLQIAARVLVQEMESEADHAAAQAMGEPGVVVRSLRKLAGSDDQEATVWHRLQTSAIERRCRLLLDERRLIPASRPALLVTAAGLALLLFFTVA